MTAKFFKPKWQYGPCKGKPCFVSDKLVCVPLEDGLSFLGLDGKKYGKPLYAPLVCFSGPHLMASFYPERMTMWTHSDQKLLCEGEAPCLEAEELTSCPWRKNVLSLRGPKQVVMVYIKMSKGCKYFLETKTLMLKKGEDGELQASDVGEVSLVSHCWLPPGDRLLVQTLGEGMVCVDASSLSCCERVMRNNNGEVVRCMAAVEGNKLFAGFESGRIDVVDVSNDTWVILETMDVRNVRWISLSPSMEAMLLTTADGSVIHRSIRDGRSIELVRKPMLELIGACAVGVSHCAAAGRDGSLVIFNACDGKPVGEVMIGEVCESVTSSPVCGMIVLGTRSGFLYVVSAVDPRNPKVVHCDNPFSSSVSYLTFDRRGRLLIAGSAATDSMHVHVFSGRPWFDLLVVVPMPGPVVNLSLSEELMFLVTLVRNGPGCDLLVWTHLPENLSLYPSNYRTDDFHTFNGGLNTLRVSDLTSDILEYHPRFGFIYHCAEELRRLPVETMNNPGEDSYSICHIKERISKLRISPNLLWLAFINQKSIPILYRIGKGIAIPIKGLKCTFIEFSSWGDSLIVAVQSQGISYFTLPQNVDEENVIPECLYFCRRESSIVRNQLMVMEKESSEFDGYEVNNSCWEPEKLDSKKQLDVIYFVLEKLCLEHSTDDSDLEDEESVLDDNAINELDECNFKKYMTCGGLVDDEAPQVVSVREIASNSGYLVQNYSVLKKLGEYSQNPDIKEFNFFCSGMKLKNVEERLSVVQDIRKYIRYRKLEFNRAFDYLYDCVDDSKEKVSDLFSEMKVMSATLPTKSERDFWQAYVQYSKDGHGFPDRMVKSEPERDRKEYEVNSPKREIEVLSDKVSSLEKEFDLQVEVLYEEKRKCNASISILELTNYCILLYTIAEKELKKCKDLVEHKMESQAVSERALDNILSEVDILEEEYAQLFVEGFRLERTLENKVQTKVDSERLRDLYLLPPSTPVSNLHEAWSSNYLLEKPSPGDGKMWETLCKYRDRRIKIEHLLHHVESQTGDLIDIKNSLKEKKEMLSTKKNHLYLISSGITTLLSKLNYTVHKLLTVDLAWDEENADQDILEKGCAMLNSRLKELEELLKIYLYHVEKNDDNLLIKPVRELAERLENAKKVYQDNKVNCEKILEKKSGVKYFRMLGEMRSFSFA